MKVLFLHGFGSDPNGIRPTFLKQQGYDVIHPALDDLDFEASVCTAQQAFQRHRPDVVVGSSRGGAVALSFLAPETPLVLIAPAWSRWGERATVGPATLILHSQHDDVVPIENSRELLKQSGLPKERLIVVGQNHKMTDAAAFDALVSAIERVAKM